MSTIILETVMRVTKEVKQATRENILLSAERLFSEVGYLDTTSYNFV